MTTLPPPAVKRRSAPSAAPDANPPAWAVQLLTTDSVIHGYLPQRPAARGWQGVLSYLAAPGSSAANGRAGQAMLELASAEICSAHAAAVFGRRSQTGSARSVPAGPSAVAVSRAPRIRVFTSAVLALLPADDAGERLALATLDQFADPAGVVLYVGPYLLRGQVWQPAGRRRAGLWALVSDVEIECLRPGVDLAGLKGPIVAVRRGAIQAQHSA